MSRKTGNRGYLQQLAQPIAPGETVLIARPGPAGHAIETGPFVPLIEDRFEMPDGERTVFARSAARLREPAAMSQESPGSAIQTAMEPVDRGTRRDAIAQPSAKAAASAAKPHRTDPGHPRPLPPSASAIGAVPGSDSPGPGERRPSARVRREESPASPPIQAEATTVAGDLKASERARNRRSSPAPDGLAQSRPENPAARGIEPDSAAEAAIEKTAAKNSQSRQQDYLREHTAIEPATEERAVNTPPQKGRPEVQAEAGPRVHIGTVEIRMALPQPPAPAPAAMAPLSAQGNEAAHARGRSGPAEPLARGLEWSYGLVQG